MAARLTYGLACLRSYSLEPIPKVVESEELVVIPHPAPESLLGGARCGSLNTAARPTGAACAIRAI